VKFGLQVSSFTWPGGARELGPTLERVVRTADEVGFDSIWVMDHLFQIRSVGAVEEPMLDCPRLHRGAYEASADRADGRWHSVPPARDLDQVGDHP
jgi:alkanesulfonate monooxygenase SsuD/methylene tetrahydromethanopterin reductase-like flavin-dependent oxidoreductase (luciferase family)